MDKALSDICEMKNQEGKAIGEDLLARSLTCQNWVDELEKLSKYQPAMHFSKLKSQIPLYPQINTTIRKQKQKG